MDPQFDYTGSGGLVEFLCKDFLEDERALVQMFGLEHVQKMAVMWQSPAGKSAIAKPLLKMFPEHKTYVEPFAGSGAMFFAKEPAEKEVLNDLDAEIAFAFGFVQKVTDAQIKKLEGMQWWLDTVADFQKLRDSSPKGDVARFHKFLLLKLASFMGIGRTPSPAMERIGSARTSVPMSVKRMAVARERLAGVVIRNEDFEKVCKEFDGPDTFQFHDPPYHGFRQFVGEEKWDEAKHADVVKGLKSRVLVTCGEKGDPGIWKGLNVKSHKVPVPWAKTGAHSKTGTMLVITNFDAKTVSMMRKDQRVQITEAQAEVLASGVPMVGDLLRVLKDLNTGIGRLQPSEVSDDAVSLEVILQSALAAHQVLKGQVPDEELAGVQKGIVGLAELLGMDAAAVKSLAEHIEKAVALEPAAGMTTEEKRESQALRSKKWGITALDGQGERLTFPPKWSTTLEDYGDPVNLMYPCDTVERARNARVRFKQFADGYPNDGDRKTVHTRIVEAELKLGIKPAFDEKDALDLLLPEALRGRMEKGLGQGGLPEGTGGADRCVCPACGHETPHDRGAPCNETKCPKCGAAMTGKDAPGDTTKAWDVTLLKADPSKEERYVLGFVLRANVEDKQGDIYDEAAVREAMFSWMEKGHKEGFLHREAAGNRVVLIENFQALADFEIPGSETADGKAEAIKKGDWLQGWKILDDKMWADVQVGKLTGFSIGGRANRTPEG